MVHKIGNGDQNTLTGTDGDDWLEGLGNTDFLVGSKGNDKLDGGSGSDFAVYTGSATGVSVDLGAGKTTGQGTDTLISIENIDGSMKDDTIKLSGIDNFANGNGGKDTIYGYGGRDQLLGGDNNDKLYAGTGSDEYLDGQDGNDFVAAGIGDGTMASGGDGTDWLSYADTDPSKGLNIYLNDSEMFYEAFDGIYHMQSLSSFENVEGSKRGDRINATDQVNVIKGLDGDDQVSALGGNDDVYGGKGKDTIHGDDGKDEIFGGDGNDALYGDVGDDVIHGDKNDDTIYGGTGVDKLYGDEGNDVIHTGYAAGSTQQLFGGSGNDELWGTGGDFVVKMTGGSGKDVMHGFSAENRFIFTEKSDSVVGANRDRIVDFFRSEGDKIDLSGIDAKEGTSGNQTFSYVGSNAFSAKGQLHVVQSNGSWLVEGNTDNDLQAEFQIQVSFLGNGPGAQDFVL